MLKQLKANKNVEWIWRRIIRGWCFMREDCCRWVNQNKTCEPRCFWGDSRGNNLIFFLKMVKISDKGDYIVTFDPLDGSSIISTNFTVGTIVGIWKSDETYILIIKKNLVFWLAKKARTKFLHFVVYMVLELQLWPTTLN